MTKGHGVPHIHYEECKFNATAHYDVVRDDRSLDACSKCDTSPLLETGHNLQPLGVILRKDLTAASPHYNHIVSGRYDGHLSELKIIAETCASSIFLVYGCRTLFFHHQALDRYPHYLNHLVNRKR